MKIMNLLIEKRVMFMSLLLLLIFVSLVSGAIFFRYDDISPQVGGIDYSDSNSQPIVRKHEINTGTVMWSNGRKVKVYVLGHARGVGHGEGTLAPVTILGKTIPSHQDGSEEVGTKTKFGKWDYGNKTVWTYKAENIPIRSRETSFPWSAEGSIKLSPYGWQETVSSGGGFTIPLTITGTFSTSGRWITVDSKATTQHAASGSSGTHTVEVKYYCYSCKAEGDTKESIGGKDTHSKITCEREGCGVQYRKCDTSAAWLHLICDGCSTWRCDSSTGKYHANLRCNGRLSNGKFIDSCRDEYWTCASDAWEHSTRMVPCGGCGEPYMGCAYDKHRYIIYCHIQGPNGESCIAGGNYVCQGHTCQYPEPGLSYVETSSRSHSVTLYTKTSGYSKIEWYIYGPNDDGDLGRKLDTTSPSSSTLETKATFSLNLPVDAVSGWYKFTAVITPHGSSSDDPYAYSYFFRVD